MRAEAQAHIDQINAALALLRRFLDWDRALKRLERAQRARSRTRRCGTIPRRRRRSCASGAGSKRRSAPRATIERELADTVELIEMAEAEGDDALVDDGVAQPRRARRAGRARQGRGAARRRGRRQQHLCRGQCRRRRHREPGLGRDAAAHVHALGRAPRLKVELIDHHAGEQAGIKSATLLIKGENAYGNAKTESGVHRLVRISPYDANARRHTSFSSVWVYPVVDDDIDIEINESELRIDTYRASGAGGQHINTTDSAVRITHMPTGIVVACQNERSQHKNRAEAMKQLKARLYEAELQKREAEASAANAAKTDIGWGHQIRSYVLQPYQLVKDLRTGVTSTAPGDVLDGDLDRFMAAALSQRVTGETVEVEDVE